MNTSLASRKETLADRGAMLAKTRAFFAERGVLEVDTAILSPTAPVDKNIDVMQVAVSDTLRGYLHTSPEYAMKRLLSEGIGDIYQLSHVFRAGEIGRHHNPEFTMLEWYRHKLSYQELIEETLELMRLFLGQLPSQTLSYREALQTHTGIDVLTATQQELYERAKDLGLSREAIDWERDILLSLLFSSYVEPHLGKNCLTVILDYPPTQAALAKIEDGVARRFEVYAEGIELANGYDELTNPAEQRKRLIQANEERIQKGSDPLPIDEAFLQALEQGMPDCRGVAVGFDRLMLLRHKASSLGEVMPFIWE